MSLFICIILLLFYALINHYSNKLWHKKPMRNFPFFHKGKEFWYSRSVACVMFAFSKNENGECNVKGWKNIIAIDACTALTKKVNVLENIKNIHNYFSYNLYLKYILILYF